jgi:hypothetical protein
MCHLVGPRTVSNRLATTSEPLRISILAGELLSLYVNIGEFPEVLIKSCHWNIFCRRDCGNQTVHKMNLSSSVSVQSVEVSRCLVNLNARTRNRSAKRRSDRVTWMLVEGLEHKYTLGQNNRQQHNQNIGAIASLEPIPRPSSELGGSIFNPGASRIVKNYVGRPKSLTLRP